MEHHSGLCRHCEYAAWNGAKYNPSAKNWGIRQCQLPRTPKKTISFRKNNLIVVKTCTQYSRYPGAEN